jgi:hypothetical protein
MLGVHSSSEQLDSEKEASVKSPACRPNLLQRVFEGEQASGIQKIYLTLF